MPPPHPQPRETEGEQEGGAGCGVRGLYEVPRNKVTRGPENVSQPFRFPSPKPNFSSDALEFEEGLEKVRPG